MATATACVVLAGRTGNGYCLKVKGSGTMLFSSAVHDFVTRSFANGAESVVVDLNECTYLDSTFLGCLITLHRQYNKNQPHRFVIAADEAKVAQLLAPARLDTILPLTTSTPQCVGECVPITITNSAEKAAFAQHILECHQLLAEIPGPNQAKFAMIAQHMADELAGGAEKPVAAK